jgi:hypothetical protein
MIFICYRREDSVGHTGRLFDRLVQHYGRERVFMDLDGIAPGEDFVEAIQRRVGACDVELVVVGPAWARAADSAGRRRLEDPDDFVRLEVLAALNRDVRVIPVLVGGAVMPGAADVPDALRAFVRRQAFELSDRSFHDSVSRLIASLETPPQTSTTTVRKAPAASGRATHSSPRRGDVWMDLDVTFEESLDDIEKELDIRGRTVKLSIPAGVDSGATLRVPDQGEPLPDGDVGDLYVVISVRESSAFAREGVDLHCAVDVPAAVLKAGGVASTSALGTRGAVEFTIPPGTKDGARLQLAGRGMPVLDASGTFGDLYVTVRAV